MKYNLLGNTGLKVSELCLGTMTFGGRGFWTAIGTLDQQAVDHLVRTAVDGGINFLDTANVYSEGLSEEMTGKAIRNLEIDDNAFKGVEAIIHSMTPSERENPAILNGSRRKRIAEGSGTSIQEVNRLMKQFEDTRKMMKMVTANKGKNMANVMRNMKSMN